MHTAILVGELIVAGGLLAYIYKALVEQMVDLGWVDRRSNEVIE